MKVFLKILVCLYLVGFILFLNSCDDVIIQSYVFKEGKYIVRKANLLTQDKDNIASYIKSGVTTTISTECKNVNLELKKSNIGYNMVLTGALYLKENNLLKKTPYLNFSTNTNYIIPGKLVDNSFVSDKNTVNYNVIQQGNEFMMFVPVIDLEVIDNTLITDTLRPKFISFIIGN